MPAPPPLEADERTMLAAWLDFHRQVLVDKCEGLDPEQLATRSVPPSTLSLLGLVRHMAGVERHWFRRIFLGAETTDLYWTAEDRDADFHDATPDNAREALQTFADECRQSRQVLAGVASLDDVAARPLRGRPLSMRWILVHMIEEYARHNGHADLLRERIDGAVG